MIRSAAAFVFASLILAPSCSRTEPGGAVASTPARVELAGAADLEARVARRDGRALIVNLWALW